MWLIQIFGIIFLLFAITRVINRARDRTIHLGAIIIWLAVFCGILVVIIQPQIASWFASILGISRGTDLVVYSSIVFLFYLVFRIHVHLERIEHRFTRIIRYIALSEKEDISQLDINNVQGTNKKNED